MVGIAMIERGKQTAKNEGQKFSKLYGFQNLQREIDSIMFMEKRFCATFVLQDVFQG